MIKSTILHCSWLLTYGLLMASIRREITVEIPLEIIIICVYCSRDNPTWRKMKRYCRNTNTTDKEKHFAGEGKQF